MVRVCDPSGRSDVQHSSAYSRRSTTKKLFGWPPKRPRSLRQSGLRMCASLFRRIKASGYVGPFAQRCDPPKTFRSEVAFDESYLCTNDRLTLQLPRPGAVRTACEARMASSRDDHFPRASFQYDLQSVGKDCPKKREHV